MQLEEVRVTLANGDVHRVAITNRAEVAFEKEAALRKWPSTDALQRTYQAWWELVKMSKTLDCTFDDFSSVLCVEAVPYVTQTRLDELVRTGKMTQLLADELLDDGLVLEAAIDVDPTRTAQPSDKPST